MSIIHLFEGQDVRFVGTWENPEWIAADVCKILDIQDPSSAVCDFDEDEAGIVTMRIRSENGVEQSRQMLTIKEQGLYQLISVSRKPEAKRFKKWMFGEVLPSIRKTGSYSLNQRLDIYSLDEITLRKLVLLANLKFAPELIGSEPELSAELVAQDIASLDARLHDMDIDVAFHLFSLFAIENEIWNRPLPERIEDRVDFDTVPQKIQRFRSNAENPTYIEAAAEFQAKIDRTQLAGNNNQKQLSSDEKL
jgi:prophage antirepressor-like protein